MTVRLLPVDLAVRQALARAGDDAAPWTPLADALAAELAPWLDAPLPLPVHKARLTRGGGRCPVHGTLLDFDPRLPHTHRCPRCARDYTGAAHDDWWAMGAQLWTAERAVHAAVLYALRGDARHAALAARILREITARYASWPNDDNVLGPSRPFFSTYLESIWLLNLCHALDWLEATPSAWSPHDAEALRERVIAPSAALIAGYPEGASNRQVWNEVAILSAWRMLGDDAAVRARAMDPAGLRGLIAQGLLDDGAWYEGENYHLFAHRGLWYGVALLHAIGAPVEAPLQARYAAGFFAPFAGVLPDDTFPSRRDSPYASSLRQWRIAEWCELGWAHTGDPRLAGVLTRLYDGQAPHGDTGRWCSTADAERQMPAHALTRASLSWRALVMGASTPAPEAGWSMGSVCLPSHGIAVLRRDAGRSYIALDGGQGGGGHGHPDQLALTLQTGVDRWLDDPGAGSYTERALHWYRSTLAHAAPLVDGQSQARHAALLVAFEDRGALGWMVKRVDGLADGVVMERTVVVGDGYLLDQLTWEADRSRTITLPVAADATLMDAEGHPVADEMWTAAAIVGAGGVEDGFDFLDGATTCSLDATALLQVRAHRAVDTTATSEAPVARLWVASSLPATLGRATVPAPPGHGHTLRHWISATGTRGTLLGVWSWPTAPAMAQVTDVTLTPAAGDVVARITTADGTTAVHGPAPHGWHVELLARHARSSVDLDRRPDAIGMPAESVHRDAPPRQEAIVIVPTVAQSAGRAGGPVGTPIPGAWQASLGAAHYIATERPWAEAGAPTAQVALAIVGDEFVLDVRAATGPIVVPPAGQENPLDNERAEVNADGVQWYFAPANATANAPANAGAGWTAAGVQLPASGPGLRADAARGRPVVPGSVMPTARWCETADGWGMQLRWPVAVIPTDAAGQCRFECVVNERPPFRERRRGQLALSGGGGFGYLAGDRRPATAGILLQLPAEPTRETIA